MNEEFKQALKQIIGFVQANIGNLSSETKLAFANFIRNSVEKLSSIQEQEQIQTFVEQKEDLIPDSARLLWVASGGNPEVFTRFLSNYPDPALASLLRNPAQLVEIIQNLQQEIPQGEPSELGVVPESWLPSSNVYGFHYDPRNSQMYVKFNGKDSKESGPTYVYSGVPEIIAKIVESGSIPAKTSGKNQWGQWWVQKNPSIGAAVNQLLVKGGFAYSKID